MPYSKLYSLIQKLDMQVSNKQQNVTKSSEYIHVHSFVEIHVFCSNKHLNWEQKSNIFKDLM